MKWFPCWKIDQPAVMVTDLKWDDFSVIYFIHRHFITSNFNDCEDCTYWWVVEENTFWMKTIYTLRIQREKEIILFPWEWLIRTLFVFNYRGSKCGRRTTCFAIPTAIAFIWRTRPHNTRDFFICVSVHTACPDLMFITHFKCDCNKTVSLYEFLHRIQCFHTTDRTSSFSHSHNNERINYIRLYVYSLHRK